MSFHDRIYQISKQYVLKKYGTKCEILPRKEIEGFDLLKIALNF